MKSKTLKKDLDIRCSHPNFHKNLLHDDDDDEEENEAKLSITDAINKNLMKYKEIKMIVKKTGLQPAYFVFILSFLLLLLFIGYFETYLTTVIATFYPLYISMKTLQSGEKEDRIQWLTYW